MWCSRCGSEIDGNRSSGGDDGDLPTNVGSDVWVGRIGDGEPPGAAGEVKAGERVGKICFCAARCAGEILAVVERVGADAGNGIGVA